MLLVWALGCVHRVEITTNPVGAAVTWNGAPVGRTPAQVEVRPFQPRVVEVSLAGYRTVRMELREGRWGSFLGQWLTLRWGRALGLRLQARVELRLVREHGGVGTWDPDDLD